jgi:hypothetical protein
MPSFYRFNVSRNGRHYLTADDQFMTGSDAQIMLADLQIRFSASEGFKVELSRWECSGRTIA